MDAFVQNAPFTTSGQLVELVDRKVIAVLRDGRKIVGVLRSYDQYANLVLLDAVERLQHGLQYADLPRGVFVIRGENLMLLGDIDLDLEDEPPIPLERIEKPEEIERLADLVREEEESRRRLQQQREKILLEVGGYSSAVLQEGDNY